MQKTQIIHSLKILLFSKTIFELFQKNQKPTACLCIIWLKPGVLLKKSIQEAGTENKFQQSNIWKENCVWKNRGSF